MRMKILATCVVIGVIVATCLDFVHARRGKYSPRRTRSAKASTCSCQRHERHGRGHGRRSHSRGYDEEWLVGAGPRGGPSRGDRQAGHDHHQHQFAPAPFRQQPSLRQDWRRRRRPRADAVTPAGPRQLPGRERPAPPADDVSRSVDADARQGADRPLPLRPRQHRRRRLGRAFRRAGSCTSATSSRSTRWWRSRRSAGGRAVSYAGDDGTLAIATIKDVDVVVAGHFATGQCGARHSRGRSWDVSEATPACSSTPCGTR